MPPRDSRSEPGHAYYEGALVAGCMVCRTQDNLMDCAGCKVVKYCGKDHQTHNWQTHKTACKRVRREQRRVVQEEQDLREASEASDGLVLPVDVFETCAGHFWSIPDTRDYMRAMHQKMMSLVDMKSEKAVQAGLDVCMEMHRLCRGDNMGIRDITPCQIIRLGKDQECYDFLKWYATTGMRSDYDWGDMDLPYLDVKNADIFEPVDIFDMKYPDVAHLVAVFAIKLRLLLDLELVSNSDLLAANLPRELTLKVSQYQNSNVLFKRKELLKKKGPAHLIKILKSQLETLYNVVNRANKFFWPGLLNPGPYFSRPSAPMSKGSPEETHNALLCNYAAFAETAGSIRRIEQRRKFGKW